MSNFTLLIYRKLYLLWFQIYPDRSYQIKMKWHCDILKICLFKNEKFKSTGSCCFIPRAVLIKKFKMKSLKMHLHLDHLDMVSWNDKTIPKLLLENFHKYLHAEWNQCFSTQRIQNFKIWRLSNIEKLLLLVMISVNAATIILFRNLTQRKKKLRLFTTSSLLVQHHQFKL